MAPSIEDAIQKAMEEGKFDNLPGKGKPLNLEENPLEDPEWRAAFRALRNGGFSLPWIEDLREIQESWEVAHRSLANTWVWRQNALAQGEEVSLVEKEWGRAATAFQEKVQELNKKIRKYNLGGPADVFQKTTINAEREIERITKTNQ
jgi:DnaJ family protein C protein 28